MSNHRLLLHDLTVSYGRIPAVHHVDLELTSGHCIGLLGPNGAGKTTLIKAIAGMVRLETGRVEIEGHGAARSGNIAYLPQRSMIDWDFPVTVRGMVEMGRFAALGGYRAFSKSDQAVVEKALEVTRLSTFADRQISALSGGQQQRAFLARAYAQRADYYLLDEPFGGLDTNAQADLREIMKALAEEGKLLLVSHHDLKSVPEIFDEVILLNSELVAFGPTRKVFTPENIERTYRMPPLTAVRS